MGDAAAKLWLFGLVLLIAVSVSVWSQTPSGPEPPAKTVVDMTEAELHDVYHKELSHLEFDPNQEGLKHLLEKAGESVSILFRDFSNTSANERVEMQSKRKGSVTRISTKSYNYLILPGSELTRVSFREYRTDKENRAVNQKLEPGFCISSGYAGLCLCLHPTHQPYSKFRYLGRERRKPRAHIIAFAQNPESGDYMAQYFDVNTAVVVNFLVQGLVWLDPDSYQILRMRTSMQVPYTTLKEQITDIIYEKVEFESIQKQFWLPHEVNISWELPEWTFRNQHKYSDYHLFSVESEYKISKPKID